MEGNDLAGWVVGCTFQPLAHADPSLFHNNDSDDIYDLADLTPQCGRRGDALKMYLSWQYYGKAGLSDRIKTAYARADELYSILDSSKDIIMVSRQPLPCLQVCFYFAPDQQVLENEKSTRITQDVVHALVSKGFMIDYAPGEKGKFFRVVIHPGTTSETLRRLATSIEELGRNVFDSI